MNKISSRSLVKLINEMLVRLEINAECVKVIKTRFRSQDYEEGARVFYAIVKTNDGELQMDGYIPYHELTTALSQGKKLILEPTQSGRIFSLQDYSITYK